MNEDNLTTLWNQPYVWCPLCGHRQRYIGKKEVDTISLSQIDYSVHLRWICDNCNFKALVTLD